MSVIINRLTNGNVYVDETNFFGAIEEANLPEVKAVESEHKSLGMIGKVEFPAGIDKMECKIKWNSLSESAMAYSADFYTPRTIMIRSSLEKYDANLGRVAQVPVVATIRGQFKKLPGIAFKQQDNPDMDSDITVTAYNLMVNGVEIVDIDVLAQVYRVYGVDLMLQYRNNLGI